MSQTTPDPNQAKLRWALGATVALGILLAIRLTVGSRGVSLPRELSVETRPAGASVFIDGRLAGKTPLRVTDIQGGKYSVRLEKENYSPVVFPIELVSGTTKIDEALPPRGTGTIKVEIAPAGAEVVLDGELAGHTPLELTGVPVGSHDLLVRKTNFKTFTQRIEMKAGETLPFKDIVLEDVVLAMLQSAIDKDSQRVSAYDDMGHYLFINNRIKEAADYYVQGLKVAGQPLTFPKDATAEERYLEQRLRNEETQRITESVRRKQSYNGKNMAAKDMEMFTARVQEQIEKNTKANVSDWAWVQVQSENFNKDGKFDKSERLYLDHIEAARGMPSVAQAYIGVVSVRLRMNRVTEAIQASNELMNTPYGKDAAILRQAANAIYTLAGGFVGAERAQLLSQSEVLLRRGLAASPKRSEMGALCKFELAYVLVLEERVEESLPLYRDSVVETNDASTKELRMQREVDALRKLKRNDQAVELLKLLVKSPRDYIKRNAEEQLRELGTK